MTNQEMKLLHERMKKEDPKLFVLMEKCFDAGVLSGKEPAQRTWVGLTDSEIEDCYQQGGIGRAAQILKEKNT